MSLIDKYNRVHDYLRISLTDVCNLNCLYCNPRNYNLKLENHYEILSDDNIILIIKLFLKLGFNKIRLTGGEPLARREIIKLLEKINELKSTNHFELSITTNGTLLNGNLSSLKMSGLDRINFSLDSLNEDTFKLITGYNGLRKVLNSINAALETGFRNIKINTVILKGINSEEIIDFCDYAISKNINIRFIEYMPFSENGWDHEKYMSSEEIRRKILDVYDLELIEDNDLIAKNYHISGKLGKISFISPISDHFCSTCNRLRLTSDGKLKLCLFSPIDESLDLKSLIENDDFSESDILNKISEFVTGKEKEHKPISDLINLKNLNMLKIGG